MKRKKGYMDMELFKKIADEVANYPDTKFYMNGYGEPLLHPDIVEAVRYATQAGIKRTFLNTNGMLLNEKTAEGLIDAGLHCLVVSIDGYSRETYEKIRIGGKRDTVYENVTRYLELLKEKGLKDQVCEVQIIEMKETLPEIEQWKKYWGEKGARLKLKPLMNWGNNTNVEVSTYQTRLACGASNLLQIDWEGNIPYCNCGGVDVDLFIGNVREMSIREAWEDKKKNFCKYHIEHEFDKLPKFCQECPDWAASFPKHYDSNGKRIGKGEK
jgi:radical SAM protein with 4Fe4S-binding SPASM domain